MQLKHAVASSVDSFFDKHLQETLIGIKSVHDVVFFFFFKIENLELNRYEVSLHLKMMSM